MLFLSVAAGQTTRADSVVLPPDADTTIFQAVADNNLGANTNLLAGANADLLSGRALIRFNLAGAIPSNAVIQSVSLTLTVLIVPPGGGAASTFDLRRVLVDWGEGAGTNNQGRPAIAGEATWNARFYPSNLWSTPGGAISNDFSAVASASMLLGDVGTYTFASNSNLVSNVQGWLQNPGANYGWLLMSESENVPYTARRIGSRESVTNAPVLIVEFTVPTAPTVHLLDAGNGTVELGFLASSGQSYSVQFRDSLVGSWETLTNIGPQNTTTNMIVVDPLATNSQRYYRIGAY